MTGRKVKVMILQDTVEQSIPPGWLVHSAVALRTTGVHATVGLILLEEQEREMTAGDCDGELA